MRAMPARLAVTLAALACGASAGAHHSISTIDITTPLWVKGTVVSYKAMQPHVMIELDELLADGKVRRWTIEGPNLLRLGWMDAADDFLLPGDSIEVCGFLPKNAAVMRAAFFHGHLLVMPDGHLSPWGPYGKLDNCLRPGDDPQAWIDFLDADPIARGLWCQPHVLTQPSSTVPQALVEEVHAGLAEPCRRQR